jgi:hypothetical protein
LNEPGAASQSMLDGAGQQEQEHFAPRDRPTLAIFLR